MNSKWTRRVLSLILAVALFFFIITASIALPIYIRPFYYAHIEPLNLSEASGYSEQQIKVAYDEVLDYLTLPNTEFSAGDMAYTPSGRDHFADCKSLFTLNLVVLIISVVIISLVFIIKRRSNIKLYLGKHTPYYYTSVSIVSIFGAIALLAAIDFDSAFTVFHKIFFAGKENWLFDPSVDEIVSVLPPEFFRNCAILIGGSVFLICAALLLTDYVLKKKKYIENITQI